MLERKRKCPQPNVDMDRETYNVTRFRRVCPEDATLDCTVIQKVNDVDYGKRKPAYLRVFGAFPFEVKELRGFYYNCTDREYAKLEECQEGFIYDSSTESCVDDSGIVSRTTGRRTARSGEVTQRNDEKVLGRNIQLGALYYGQTDTINPQFNFWSEETLTKMRRQEDNERVIDFEIFTTESFLDRKNRFDMFHKVFLFFISY